MGIRSRSKPIVDTLAQSWAVRRLAASSLTYWRASVNKVAEGAGDRSGTMAMRTFSSPIWSVMLEASMILKEVGASSLLP